MNKERVETFVCAGALLFDDPCSRQCSYCANEVVREELEVTVTVSNPAGHGYRVGDVVRFSDTRGWWRRLVDWVRRRRPNLTMRVTSVVSGTVICMEKRKRNCDGK